MKITEKKSEFKIQRLGWSMFQCMLQKTENVMPNEIIFCQIFAKNILGI